MRATSALGLSLMLAATGALPAAETGRCGDRPCATPDWRVPLAGAPESGDRVVVEGDGTGDAFRPRLARVEPRTQARPARRSLPIDAPLLGRVSLRAFGSEERAAFATDGGGIALSCRPGDQPAGLALESEGRPPAGALLRLQLAGRFDQGFAVGEGIGGADILAAAPLLTDGGSIALGPAAEDEPLRVTLLCPAGGGDLRLADLRLAPGVADRIAPRSAWAWRPALWRDEPRRLLEETHGLGLRELYVSVDVDPETGLRDALLFGAFLRDARAGGLRITIVEGDAAMALPAGRRLALERLAHLRAYQETAPLEARFDGIQYDIEPYLLPDFVQAPETVMRGWAETIAALRAAAPGDLDVVVPFWLTADEGALRHVMPALVRGADGITIMAYRTTPDAIAAAAEPLLAWAGRAGLRARVAVENGPLPDETFRVYRRAEAGELRLKRDEAGRWVAALDSGGRSVHRFAFSHEGVSPAAAVSFLGDSPRFLAALDAAERRLRAWPAFAGMALHGAID